MSQENSLQQELEYLKQKIQLLEDKEAIRDLLSRYAFNADLSRFDNFVKLWTEDGEFITDGSGSAVISKGREEIKDFLTRVMPASNAASQHLQLDYVIEIDGDTATATGYQLITVPKPDREGFGIARCAIRFFRLRRVEGKWLIQQGLSSATTDDAACQKLIPHEW